MRIPFDIKFRPQIESGEYKVVNSYGEPVRIICWDARIDFPNGIRPIISLQLIDQKYEVVSNHLKNGKIYSFKDAPADLFIVTPEEELTEFEKTFIERVFHQKVEDLDEENKEIFREDAHLVLDFAREQLIKDGYVIEKKAFHDAVENISNKHLAEMSVEYSIHCKIEDGTRHAIMNWKAFQKVAQKFIDIGKAEALKDLPRWRKWENGACGNSDNIPIAIVKRGIDYKLVSTLGIQGEQYIMLSDLEKLPGFKED